LGTVPASLTIGFLYDQEYGNPNPALFWVQESRTAFQLAIMAVNNDSSILPGTELIGSIRDTHAQPSTALAELIHHIDDDHVVAVIGPSTSGEVPVTAFYSSLRNTLMVSSGATSAALADKTGMPYFFRNVGSDTAAMDAYVALLLKMGWQNVAMLSLSTGFAVGDIAYLAQRLLANSITVRAQATFTNANDVNSAVMTIKASGCPIILVVAGQFDILYQTLSNHNLIGTDYIYVMNKGIAEWSASPAVGVWPNLIVVGAAIYPPNPFQAHAYELWNNYTNKQTVVTIANPPGYLFDNGDGLPDFWAGFVYDAVYLLAYTFHNMLAASQDVHNITQLYNAFKVANFTLTTGVNAFNSHQDRVLPFSYFLLNGAAALTADKEYGTYNPDLPTSMQVTIENPIFTGRGDGSAASASRSFITAETTIFTNINYVMNVTILNSFGQATPVSLGSVTFTTPAPGFTIISHTVVGNVHQLTFKASVVGNDVVTVQLNGVDVSNSPFTLKVHKDCKK